jgi:NAD(P)H-flavin reductase
MSPIFWEDDILGREFELMGPLGINLVKNIEEEKVFLFAFGVGISVIKSVFLEALKAEKVKEIVLMTGDLNEDEILYRDFFEEEAQKYPEKKFEIRRVLSQPKNENYPLKGYIQDHLDGLNFENSLVYVCGREKYCQFLIDEIKKKNFGGIKFLVEGFH